MQKVIARRGAQRRCAEGLSAKRSLRGGVHREFARRGVQRGCSEGSVDWCTEDLSAKRSLHRGSVIG